MNDLKELVQNNATFFALKKKNSAIKFYYSETKEKTKYKLILQKFYGENSPNSSIWGDLKPKEIINFLKSKTFEKIDAINSNHKRDITLEKKGSSWENFTKKIQAALKEGSIEKIVPSCIFQAEIEDLDIYETFCQLFSQEEELNYKFFLRYKSFIFLGNSPELLFSVNNKMIKIPAIAGTLPYKKDISLDDFKEKEKDEHRFVEEGIKIALKRIGIIDYKKTDIQIINTRNLSHLFSEFSFNYNQINLDQLTAELHPTPAISGYPKSKSLHLLREFEGYDRGLYSSPIHLSDEDDDSITSIVAIRSALFINQFCYLFAGAGYVKESSSEKEFTEITNKIKSIADLYFRINQ
ncbi:MAG: chorismate-binding protein [Oligoflexia bacterium]|nr:chorismate-binding protein [Oligoflexia bacterium]